MNQTTQLTQFFTAMGNEILDAWQKESFDDSVFSKIAYQALLDSDVHCCVNLESLTACLMSTDKIPAQPYPNARFGDFRLCLFNCERFYIEIILWLEGTTTIHQHAFSGAFAVISGSSIHTRYHFSPTHELTASLLFGDVVFQSIEQLNEGDVREIIAGAGTAHSLFHLAHPNISIVVRTHRDKQISRQFNYLKPYLAVDPFARNEHLKYQSDFLGILLRIDPHVFLNTFIASATQLDLASHMMLIINHADILAQANCLDAVISDFRLRAPDYADQLHQSVRQLCLSNSIAAMRQKVKSENLRYFLAVLLNAPNRTACRQLLMKKYPSHDIEKLICDWLCELTTTIDTEINEISEDSLPFIELLVRGLSFEEILENLAHGYDELEISTHAESLRELYDYFHHRSILSNLLN